MKKGEESKWGSWTETASDTVLEGVLTQDQPVVPAGAPLKAQ